MTITFIDHLLRLFQNPPSDVSAGATIPEKKLKGARSYAHWGQEVPLVVFDNTVFGSAKNGAVITTHALYVDTHPERIDLAWIRTMPVYGEHEGTLPLPHRPAKLPKMTLDETQDAFLRALEVIVGWNNGLLNAASHGPPVPGAMGELALRCLGACKLDIGGHASRRKLLNAAAAAPEWLDTLAGETLVAYGDETVMGKGDEFIVLTDRRLLAHVHGRVTTVPYAQIGAARAQRVTLAGRLLVDLYGGSATLDLVTLDQEVPAIAQFLAGIAALPPEQRWSPPQLLASAEDPSGAATLGQRLPVPDPRLPVLLRLVQAGLAAGKLSVEAARDHVERIRLYAANAAVGRGMSQGARLSPLHGDDLLVVLSQRLGPASSVPGDPLVRAYDFRLNAGGSTGGAVASTAVGLASLAILGVGWVSRPGSRTTLVRVLMRHLGCATGFMPVALADPNTPFSEAEPALLADLLQALAEVEPVVLLGRILWGWQAPAAALLATPPHVFTQEVASAIGRTCLTPFFEMPT